jgi:nitrogen fixation-related uncharacterized protein
VCGERLESGHFSFSLVKTPAAPKRRTMVNMISLIVALILVGVLLWAVKALPFIDDGIKKIIYVLVVVAVCLWLLSSLGLLTGFPPPRWR